MPGCTTRSTIICLVLIIGGGVAGAWALGLIDPRHEATARFQRRSDGELRDTKKITVISEEYAKIRKLMVYNFKGRPAVDQLAMDLGLNLRFPHDDKGSFTPESKVLYEQFLDSIADGITVTVEVESPEVDMIAVTVRHKEKALAPKLANRLVENYMKMVRSEMDSQLLDMRKFYETEASRYHRKVSELESARLRFAMNFNAERIPGVDVNDPVAVYNALKSTKPNERHAKALKRLNRLRELTKDKPIGDAVILELFRLEVEVEETEGSKENDEAIQEMLEVINRNFFQIRNDRLKIERELAESKEQLAFWTEKLNAVQIGLTLNVGERGLRLSFVERAPEVVEIPPSAKK